MTNTVIEMMKAANEKNEFLWYLQNPNARRQTKSPNPINK